MRLLVTGFTAFGKFARNPAEAIARGIAAELGGEFRGLEVAFGAVDELVAGLKGNPPDVWVMVGVAGERRVISYEKVARNAIGKQADVRGEIREGEIEAGSLEKVYGGLFESLQEYGEGGQASDDAGTYLCNYVYWMGVRGLPGTRCGFVHVVPEEVMGIGEQVERVVGVLRSAMGVEE